VAEPPWTSEELWELSTKIVELVSGTKLTARERELLTLVFSVAAEAIRSPVRTEFIGSFEPADSATVAGGIESLRDGIQEDGPPRPGIII